MGASITSVFSYLDGSDLEHVIWVIDKFATI